MTRGFSLVPLAYLFHSVMVNEDAVGNASLQDAVSWLFEHESGADIDQMPLV